jgi:hypothetical protein
MVRLWDHPIPFSKKLMRLIEFVIRESEFFSVSASLWLRKETTTEKQRLHREISNHIYTVIAIC